MKIKIDSVLKNTDGSDIQHDPTKPAMNLRDISINSILSPIEGDDQKKKYEKYEIFKKLRDAKKEIELTVDEIATIKNSIGRFQPPLIMGQCFDFIEGKI